MDSVEEFELFMSVVSLRADKFWSFTIVWLDEDYSKELRVVFGGIMRKRLDFRKRSVKGKPLVRACLSLKHLHSKNKSIFFQDAEYV